ncbi:right-handed parallel beta-helix repeat-containing protein [Aeromicrobium sp.]|uniref:right-handed parallel beta-helix repeat-containing protein n=1 Tax=Aeromicrobium sp. TaxID=1871063 RepID=UPI003C4DFF00
MRRVVLLIVISLFAVLQPSMAAQAHVERPSYWPDPKPDCSVSPCAGGEVPTARSLASALDAAPPGETLVVCQDDSMDRVNQSITTAKADGYFNRPSDHQALSDTEADQLLQINEELFTRCEYHEIQPAVTAAGNNDRVVVMPGLYTEPTARSQPTHDPACDQYEMPAESGDPGALSHDYQIHCPNDANLVAVIGRGPDTAPPPTPPKTNRHGIPNVGSCIRCNLQLEGSGVSADDVVVEAGDAGAGNGGPSAAGNKKDVGIFVDRADGFVLRNVTVRHAREHDIYILETDGYLFDRFKTFYAGAYGVLTFVEDHGVMQNCESAGNGDAGLYPGSGADSTDNRYKPFYPEYRFSQVVRWCDSHHNTGGFSGTDSHGTLITENNFYDNALGYTTDVFTAPGHPGFPQHGNVVEKNNFYDNNFNPYQAGTDVDPFIPAPVGTGMWIAGGNANIVQNNHFYDNWRRGAMLFAVPDALVCGPPPLGSKTPVPGCKLLGVSTSYDNKFHHNHMGVSPGGEVKPNGVDFWWDSFPTNTGNCWWSNTPAPGKKITSSPRYLPGCVGGKLPKTSIGVSNLLNEAELVACFAGFTLGPYPSGNDLLCSWTKTPPQPGGQGAALKADTTAQKRGLATICANGLASRLCTPYKAELEGVSGASSLKTAPDPFKGVKAASSEGPLGSFTCSWWRRADASHRLGMVQRIQRFATGKVDGTKALGYGAALSDAQAGTLFENRCSTFQAGPFALYKLYGAAAPFASMTR